MHIESAKLLAFTEDEFIKVLELGDKIWNNYLYLEIVFNIDIIKKKLNKFK